MIISDDFVDSVESELKKRNYPNIITREIIFDALWDGKRKTPNRRPSGNAAFALRWKISKVLPRFGYTRISNIRSRTAAFRRVM